MIWFSIFNWEDVAAVVVVEVTVVVYVPAKAKVKGTRAFQHN